MAILELMICMVIYGTWKLSRPPKHVSPPPRQLDPELFDQKERRAIREKLASPSKRTLK